VELFSGSPADQPPRLTKSWDEHRWTRLRVALSVLDRLLRSLRTGYTELDDSDTITIPYRDRLPHGGRGTYKYSPSGLAFASQTVTSYFDLVGAWGENTLDDADRPHPISTLRVVPPV
jgi:hypothetical protein